MSSARLTLETPCLVLSMSGSPKVDTSDFTAFNITPEVLQYVVEVLPAGARVLEFGAGKSTRELSKFFKVTSVESDDEYLTEANTEYIIAPRGADGFYEGTTVSALLSENEYDLIILDGPKANPAEFELCRLPFIRYAQLIKGNPYLLIDDVHRRAELRVLLALLKRRPNVRFFSRFGKSSALLEPMGPLRPTRLIPAIFEFAAQFGLCLIHQIKRRLRNRLGQFARRIGLKR